MNDTSGWHISKSVPATLVLGLIAQAGAIVWTVSMMMSDIESNSRAISGITMRMSKVEAMVQTQAVSLARIDVNIEHIRKSVERMAEK
tara:strand:- start:426 stop:689 length:264 start_codon:yes stop_codon:yes gene_type:complete